MKPSGTAGQLVSPMHAVSVHVPAIVVFTPSQLAVDYVQVGG